MLRGMGGPLTTIATESQYRLSGIPGNPSISDTRLYEATRSDGRR